jgi:hypothetical protein
MNGTWPHGCWPWAGIARHEARYAEYLEDCTPHRPRYECILLWRASDGDRKASDPIILPVPMPR